jgi:glycerol-3-phosphate cytidylyltransferase
MKKVITYGTFDFLHRGHVSILKRAKKLGDHLIVAVTGEEYDNNRGKLNVSQSLHHRIKNVEKTKLADEIIVEEYDGQKLIDIQKHEIDIFAIGSDWIGKFDYLNEYCEVVYLPRTKGISSTKLRNETGFVKIGMIGTGNIANRFLFESKYVNNVEVVSVYGRNFEKTKQYAEQNEIKYSRDTLEEFLNDVDAVYIATPHDSHYEYIKKCLNNNKHVLCEKPMVLKHEQSIELLKLSKQKNLLLMEAIKTAYCNGFSKLVSFAKSGIIGKVIQLDASFTKIVFDKNRREFKPEYTGGSHNELMTYPLLASCKILGHDVIDCKNIQFYNNTEIDIYSKLELQYESATANLCVGIGAKKEGDLIITGTDGYIYCPAPWWLTKEFELKFEDPRKNEKFTYKFQGDGLRYEISEFASCINSSMIESYKMSHNDIEFISKYIDTSSFTNGINLNI